MIEGSRSSEAFLKTNVKCRSQGKLDYLCFTYNGKTICSMGIMILYILLSYHLVGDWNRNVHICQNDLHRPQQPFHVLNMGHLVNVIKVIAAGQKEKKIIFLSFMECVSIELT